MRPSSSCSLGRPNRRGNGNGNSRNSSSRGTLSQEGPSLAQSLRQSLRLSSAQSLSASAAGSRSSFGMDAATDGGGLGDGGGGSSSWEALAPVLSQGIIDRMAMPAAQFGVGSSRHMGASTRPISAGGGLMGGGMRVALTMTAETPGVIGRDVGIPRHDHTPLTGRWRWQDIEMRLDLEESAAAAAAANAAAADQPGQGPGQQQQGRAAAAAAAIGSAASSTSVASSAAAIAKRSRRRKSGSGSDPAAPSATSFTAASTISSATSSTSAPASSARPPIVVADLMAGVGPFAVPLALHGCTVHANDLNPDSHKWLVHNAQRNKVASTLTPYNMCGREFVAHLRGRRRPAPAPAPLTPVVWFDHAVMNLPNDAPEVRVLRRTRVDSRNGMAC